MTTPGEQGKQSGMASAIGGASEEWKRMFRVTVTAFAHSGVPFTSENITAIIGLPRGEVGSNQNNAVGAMMNAAAQGGLIRKTGNRVLSRRPRSNASEIAEWIGT